MLDSIYSFWNIKSSNIHSNEFTGYEPLYDEFDKFTNETYKSDPQGTIDAVFNLYRSINLVPIIYYTEQGIIEAIRTKIKLFLTHLFFFFIITETSKYIINSIPCGIPKYLTIEGELNMYLTGTAINISNK